MRILNAVDAITPAFERTKLVLFSPFRKGRSWKLAATGYLSGIGSFYLPFTLLYMVAVPFVNRMVGHGAAIAVVAGVLFATALFTILYFLCSRLQFAFFDIVLNRGEFVAPAWRRYGSIARPWTWIKFAVGCVAAGLLAMPAIPLVNAFSRSIVSLSDELKSLPHGQPPPPQMFNLIAGFYAAYFVVALLMGLYLWAMSTVSAFMVPSMALEGMRPAAAFRRFVTFVQRETGSFLGFVGMRFVLGMVGYMGLIIVYEIVLLILMLIFGIICLAMGFLLHLMHVPTVVLMVLWGIASMFFVFVVNGYILFLCIGSFFTFFQAHTLYFLGGRYPTLGDMLERSTPPPMMPVFDYAAVPYPPPSA